MGCSELGRMDILSGHGWNNAANETINKEDLIYGFSECAKRGSD